MGLRIGQYFLLVYWLLSSLQPFLVAALLFLLPGIMFTLTVQKLARRGGWSSCVGHGLSWVSSRPGLGGQGIGLLRSRARAVFTYIRQLIIREGTVEYK